MSEFPGMEFALYPKTERINCTDSAKIPKERGLLLLLQKNNYRNPTSDLFTGNSILAEFFHIRNLEVEQFLSRTARKLFIQFHAK